MFWKSKQCLHEAQILKKIIDHSKDLRYLSCTVSTSVSTSLRLAYSSSSEQNVYHLCDSVLDGVACRSAWHQRGGGGPTPASRIVPTPDPEQRSYLIALRRPRGSWPCRRVHRASHGESGKTRLQKGVMDGREESRLWHGRVGWEMREWCDSGGVWGCRGRVLGLDEYIFCGPRLGGLGVHHRHLITHSLHSVFKAQHNVIECHTHHLHHPES